MTVDEQSRTDLVKYRMERADETLQEARLLAKEGYYNAAFNRLYYACFYAALAVRKMHRRCWGSSRAMLCNAIISLNDETIRCHLDLDELMHESELVPMSNLEATMQVEERQQLAQAEQLHVVDDDVGLLTRPADEVLS